MGDSAADLTVQDINNLFGFLGRVDLKGSEAQIYAQLENKLVILQKKLVEENKK